MFTSGDVYRIRKHKEEERFPSCVTKFLTSFVKVLLESGSVRLVQSARSRVCFTCFGSVSAVPRSLLQDVGDCEGLPAGER